MALIYGINPVKEAIESGKTINKIYIQKGNKEAFSLGLVAKNKGIVVVDADKVKLDKMITMKDEDPKNSQGVVASITDYTYYEVDDILKYAYDKGEQPFVIILDKIEDPHNLGAIIRSAECFGAHGIIIQKRNACQVTDVVEKTSAGAISHMRVARVTNITSTLEQLKKEGLWIYGLDMDGEDIAKTNLTGAVGIVVGNEGSGISRLVRETCDGIISIPMRGKLDSLNASVSAGVAMYEVLKQNR